MAASSFSDFTTGAVLAPFGEGPDPTGDIFTDGRWGRVHVAVFRADGTKCERCWRVVPEVTSAVGREGLCPRCVGALAAAVSL